jgi:glutathione reductase (NADPH)
MTPFRARVLSAAAGRRRPDRGEARDRYENVRVFTSDFRPMKNVFSERIERGYYKLVVDGATDRILGIHMIGPMRPKFFRRRRSR